MPAHTIWKTPNIMIRTNISIIRGRYGREVMTSFRTLPNSSQSTSKKKIETKDLNLKLFKYLKIINKVTHNIIVAISIKDIEITRRHINDMQPKVKKRPTNINLNM